MEVAEMAKMVDEPMISESSHDAVEVLRYKVLEQMSQWSSKWVSMKAENMKIQESYSELRKELEEFKSQCESTTHIELKKLDEEI